MENTIMLTRSAPLSEVTNSVMASESGVPAVEKPAVPPDVIPGMTGRTKPRDTSDVFPKEQSASSEPPRAARRIYPRRRFGVPVLHSLVAAAGTAAGVFFAVSAPAGTNLSGSLLCSSGDFLRLMTARTLWGLAFLAAEYITGYFALGRAVVWLVPLVCGLGTGAALTAAFSVYGAAALKLLPTCIAVAAAIVAGARASGDMSTQLLRLVSSGRNGMAAVLSDSPAAGEYTLRFLVFSGVILASATVEAAVRSFS